MNWDVSLYLKNKKKGKVYLNPGAFRPCQQFVPVLQECRMALLGAGPVFESWSTLDSFFEVF